MKKLTFIFFLLMTFLFLPSVASATSVTVSISCKDVTVNSTTTCTVTGRASGGKVSALSGKYSISGGATIQKFSVGSGWLGEGSGGTFDLYTDSNKSGSFSIGTFTLKGNKLGKATLTLSGLEGGDENFNGFNIANKTASFEVKAATTKTTTTRTTKSTTTSRPTTSTTMSTTTTTSVPLILTSVKVDDFDVTYENGIYYATVNADTESVNISATSAAGISIIGTGKRNLAEGKNAIELVLRNNLNQTATFQVIITRPEGGSVHDTLLSSLKVVDYPFSFNPNTKEYTVTVPSNVNEVYVIAEAENDNVVIMGDGLQTLTKGKNNFYVRISYGELSTTEYKIIVKRSYMSIIMWVIIGFLGAGLIGMGIYANINKRAAVEKVVAEKNKKLAQTNREEIAQSAPQVQLNGENVVGVGRKTVVPTRVVESSPSVVKSTVNPIPAATPNVQMVNTAPPAQIKVVKTTVVPVSKPTQENTLASEPQSVQSNTVTPAQDLNPVEPIQSNIQTTIPMSDAPVAPNVQT